MENTFGLPTEFTKASVQIKISKQEDVLGINYLRITCFDNVDFHFDRYRRKIAGPKIIGVAAWDIK